MSLIFFWFAQPIKNVQATPLALFSHLTCVVRDITRLQQSWGYFRDRRRFVDVLGT